MENTSHSPQTRWRFGRIGVITLVIVVGLFGAWAVQAVRSEGKPGPEEAVARVVRGDIEDVVAATGTLQALELVNVGAQVTGEVKALHVGIGSRVKKGQLIAEIDPSVQKNALKQAEAQEAAAKAQLEAKRAVLKQNVLALERQTRMQSLRATTREAYEAAEAALAVTKADIDAATAHLEETHVVLDTARVNLEYTRIQSPMDGVVVAVVTQPGQTLNASMSTPVIVKVARIDQMSIRAEISEVDVVRVAPGQLASFTILGEPDRRRTALLRSIEMAPETMQGDAATGSGGNATRNAAVYYNGLLEAPNEDGKLRIGMTAQVRIVLRRAEHVLTVPSSALRRKDSRDGRRRSVAVLLPSGPIQERWISIGIEDRLNAQVMSGLVEGDIVVVSSMPELGRASGRPSSQAVD
jgi:membrane fusion protein, macrolide-specific efflux system